jgi:hypothetical protein
VVDAGIADYNKVIRWIRAAAPGVQLGVPGIVPLWPPYNPNDPAELQAWRNASDYVYRRLAKVDMVLTGYYARSNDDLIEFQDFVEPMLSEAQRWGLPAYHLVSMHNEWTGEELSGDLFRSMLATTRRMADGAVMWAGVYPWNPNASWFTSTQQFQNEPHQAPSALPTLSLDPLGARLSWTTPASDISGLVVERSTDGGELHPLCGDRARSGAMARSQADERERALLPAGRDQRVGSDGLFQRGQRHALARWEDR